MSDPISAAAERLRGDTAFLALAAAEKEKRVSSVLNDLGGDGEDPLSVALVLEAVDFDPSSDDLLPPATEGPGWFYMVKTATGWADREIADVVKLKRATVQAYIGRRLPERVTKDQARAIVAALHQRRAALDRAIDAFGKHIK